MITTYTDRELVLVLRKLSSRITKNRLRMDWNGLKTLKQIENLELFEEENKKLTEQIKELYKKECKCKTEGK